MLMDQKFGPTILQCLHPEKNNSNYKLHHSSSGWAKTPRQFISSFNEIKEKLRKSGLELDGNLFQPVLDELIKKRRGDVLVRERETREHLQNLQRRQISKFSRNCPIQLIAAQGAKKMGKI